MYETLAELPYEKQHYPITFWFRRYWYPLYGVIQQRELVVSSHFLETTIHSIDPNSKELNWIIDDNVIRFRRDVLSSIGSSVVPREHDAIVRRRKLLRQQCLSVLRP